MKQWSTKTLRVETSPSKGHCGTAWFDFTDDYSVFHFSKMPDQLPDKGEVIARMGQTSLELLNTAGLNTHLLHFAPPRSLKIKLLNVLDPAKGQLRQGDVARLVPLQVIYRNMLVPGASLYRRVAAGRIALQDVGLDALPSPNSHLATPIIEFTTKLEHIDRFVLSDEALALSCLTPEQFTEMQQMTLEINRVLSRHAESVGLVLADGKVEFGVDEGGQLMLVDVAGTADENRFLMGQHDVSKQILRDYYHRFGLEAEIQRLAASGLPRSEWPAPQRLPPDLLRAVADLYRALCERWTGKAFWGTPPLEIAVDRAALALGAATVK